MRCPSCGASYDESDCSECGNLAPSTTGLALEQTEPGGFEGITESSSTPNQNGRSTLIEFPGVVRSTVPEWRRELSERVREVQERRAREAALEAEEAERRRLAEEAAALAPQLELLQQANVPPMNPLVAAALRRIERANQTSAASPPPHPQTAAAVAYVAEQEVENRSDPSTTNKLSREQTIAAEKAHSLVVVPSQANTRTPRSESKPPTKRLISDNDPSLNYLDAVPSTLRLDQIHERRAGIVPRAFSAAIDLAISVILFSPFASAIELTNADWQSFETVAFAIGAGAFVTFLYLTFSVALTGRTLGMRFLSLRTVDRRTGMLPTGTQSAVRALVYLISLLMVGLPTIYSLLDKDGYTAPDKLTDTVVVCC